jgi:hypothetical protein
MKVFCISTSIRRYIEGNKYFRRLIHENIGHYLGARTKAEKGDAINLVVDLVKQNNPSGGFVRKDPSTGRWFRIKDLEARDKVGHAIRKAVQRLEETKPKLATRLKKEYTGKQATSLSTTVGTGRHQQVHEAPMKPSPKVKGTKTNEFGQNRKEEARKPSPLLMSHLNSALHSNVSSLLPQRDSTDTLRHVASVSQSRQYNQPHAGLPSTLAAVAAAEASSGVGVARRSPSPTINSRVVEIASLLDQQVAANASLFPLSRYGYSIDPATLMSPSLVAGRNMSSSDAVSTSSPYDQLLALQLHEQNRSNNSLAIIRALQQQEEAKLRRDIEYTTRRLAAPVGNILDRILPYMPGRSQVVANSTVHSMGSSGVNPLTMASLQPMFGRSSDAATLIAFNEALKALEPQQQNQQRPPGGFKKDE